MAWPRRCVSPRRRLPRRALRRLPRPSSPCARRCGLPLPFFARRKHLQFTAFNSATSLPMINCSSGIRLTVLALLTSWSLATPIFAVPPTTVHLNEFVASNVSGIVDEDGQQADWIELVNGSAVAVNLAGWSLTDDPAEADKWVFPAVTLSPGQFLIVFASGKDR